MAEINADCIRYFDLEDKVKIKMHKLKVIELINELQSRNLPTGGKKSVLQDRLQGYLDQQAQVDASNTLMNVTKPTCIESYTKRDAVYLVYPMPETKDIQIVQLLFNGNTIDVQPITIIKYPEGVQSLCSIVNRMPSTSQVILPYS